MYGNKIKYKCDTCGETTYIYGKQTHRKVCPKGCGGKLEKI